MVKTATKNFTKPLQKTAYDLKTFSNDKLSDAEKELNKIKDQFSEKANQNLDTIGEWFEDKVNNWCIKNTIFPQNMLA